MLAFLDAKDFVGLALGVGPDRLPPVRAALPGEAVSAAGWIQFAVFGVLVAISTPLLGIYMYKVYTGRKHVGSRVFDVVDNGIYKICRIDPDGEQRWNVYAISLLLFSVGRRPVDVRPAAPAGPPAPEPRPPGLGRTRASRSTPRSAS